MSSRGLESVARVTCMALVVLCWGALASSQSSTDVVFTTVAPPPPYQTLGLVSAVSHMPPGVLDPSKPIKEAIRRLYPDLESQAKVRGANMVVLSQIVPMISGNDGWMLAFGTALKVGGAGAIEGGAAASNGASPQTEGGELSGTWVGEVAKPGKDSAVEVTLNLTPGAEPGEYIGGFILADPACEVSIKSTETQGGIHLFKGEHTNKLRCAFFTGFTVQLTDEGKMDFRMYGADRNKVHMQGLLSRS